MNPEKCNKKEKNGKKIQKKTMIKPRKMKFAHGNMCIKIDVLCKFQCYSVKITPYTHPPPAHLGKIYGHIGSIKAFGV